MKRTFAVLAIVIFSMLAVAQEKPAENQTLLTKIEKPLSFYKLEYVLREVQDGKTINSRNYLMTVEDNDRGEAKVGARVPVATSSVGGINQFQYIDVGVNINARVVGKGDYAAVRTMLEISGFAIPEQTTVTVNSAVQPVMKQMRTEMAAVVPIGKPTIIGMVDDVNSTKRYEVQLTATRLK